MDRKNILLVTTRVDFYPTYTEIRDSVDQRLIKFLSDFNIFLMPNCLRDPLRAVSTLAPKGIILTGGNSICIKDRKVKAMDLGNGSPERDGTEFILIRYAIEINIPLLGICRGMQMINVAMGGKLILDLDARRTKEKIDHASAIHSIIFKNNFIFREYRNTSLKVNSYHNQGVADNCLAKDLIPTAYSEDCIIEALMHKRYKILGVQWHPERENSESVINKKLIRFLFE